MMSRLTEETNAFGDEIDLRQYLQAFLKHWRWILLTTVVAAVVAAGLSFFVLPQTYEATALVAISSPKYLMQFSEEFRAVVQERLDTEIYKTYPELAKSDELLQQVSNSLAETLENPPASLSDRMAVESTTNVGIIRLRVRGQEPALAAQIVNTWAELYVKMLNRLYGGEEQEYKFFEEQLAAAQQHLGGAWDALAEFKADDPGLILSTEINAEKAVLNDYVEMKNTIGQLEQEIASWREHLASQSSDHAISQADELTSLWMQLEAFGVLKGGDTLPQFQILLEPVNEGRSSSEQIAFLDDLESLLQARAVELDVLLADLESNILSAQYRLQIARNEEERLTQEVENAKTLYESLSLKTEEARIASESQVGVSRLASKASIPNRPVGPRKMINTVVGAGLGLAVGLALAVFLELVRGSRSPASSNDSVNER